MSADRALGHASRRRRTQIAPAMQPASNNNTTIAIITYTHQSSPESLAGPVWPFESSEAPTLVVVAPPTPGTRVVDVDTVGKLNVVSLMLCEINGPVVVADDDESDVDPVGVTAATPPDEVEVEVVVIAIVVVVAGAAVVVGGGG